MAIQLSNDPLAVEDLLGVCVLVGASVSPAVPGGGNSTAIMFNIGRNRPLKTLAFDILNLASSGGPISFLTDAFNTCRAWGSTVGTFAGISVGVSLFEVKLEKDGLPTLS